MASELETGGWAGMSMMSVGTAALIGPAFVALEEAKIESILLNHNAVMAGYDAQYVELQADIVERDMRKKGSQVVGAARVAAGASGFAAESGSNLDAIADIDRNIELNALAIRAEGRVKAGQFRDKAESLRTQARITSTLGRTRAAATLLSSGRQLAPLVI